MKFLILTISIAFSFALSGCATLFQSDGALSSDWDSPASTSSDSGQATLYGAPSRSPASAEARQEEAQRQMLQIEMARQERDLVVGMSMSDVRSIWGEPRDVETAGSLRQGNQRWTYFEGLSSRWSMSTARKVYFESGRVVGWETGSP